MLHLYQTKRSSQNGQIIFYPGIDRIELRFN